MQNTQSQMSSIGVQDSVLTATATRNNTATRIAGSALLLTSGFVMTSSLKKDDEKNKRCVIPSFVDLPFVWHRADFFFGIREQGSQC